MGPAGNSAPDEISPIQIRDLDRGRAGPRRDHGGDKLSPPTFKGEAEPPYIISSGIFGLGNMAFRNPPPLQKADFYEKYEKCQWTKARKSQIMAFS